MENHRANVVDFQQFREARDRERLPLFDDDPPAVEGELRERLEARPISSRQLEHRERMLRHLTAR